MNYKKINFKLIYLLILIFIILFTLTGCGKVKNEKQIKNYIKKTYNIEVEILNVEESEQSKKYTLKEKDRDVVFTCTSSMQKLMVDGSSFGIYENTNDTYFESLTKSLESKLEEISQKYNVILEKDYDNLIGEIKIDGNEIDFDKTLKVANEIMDIYDFKNEPLTSSGMLATININFNGEVTEHYYNYTINGNETTLGNSENDFLQTWNIPEQLEIDAIKYINTLHEGESYIVDTSVVPGYIENIEDNYISYIIKNDKKKIRKEYLFNIDKYREDLNNNQLKNMENYMKEGTSFIYE